MGRNGEQDYKAPFLVATSYILAAGHVLVNVGQGIVASTATPARV